MQTVIDTLSGNPGFQQTDTAELKGMVRDSVLLTPYNVTDDNIDCDCHGWNWRYWV